MLSHVCLVFLSATVRNSFLFHIVQIPHYMCLWHTALCACKCANMLMNDPVGPNKDVSIRRRRRGQKQMSESQKKCQLKCSQRSHWNVLIGFVARSIPQSGDPLMIRIWSFTSLLVSVGGEPAHLTPSDLTLDLRLLIGCPVPHGTKVKSPAFHRYADQVVSSCSTNQSLEHRIKATRGRTGV